MRFSLRDLLIGVTVLCVLFALMMPFFDTLRESARRVRCSDQFKQISLAIHNYHSTHKVCPAAMSGTVFNQQRLSGLVALTPFLDAVPYWATVSSPHAIDGVTFPAMGPVPWDTRYAPWTEDFASFRCPSDPHRGSTLGRTNYAFCVGDQVEGLYTCTNAGDARGAFAPHLQLSLDEILDGLSNTVMMAEIATAGDREVQGQFALAQLGCIADSPELCRDVIDPANPEFYRASVTLSRHGRGGVFADGAGGHALAHTILPPNAPSCATEGNAPLEGVFSAGSYHPGGAHVMMGDGSVIFLTNSIESGDPTVPAPRGTSPNWQNRVKSPYGLWGALGTRSSAEAIEECGCH